MKWLLTVQGLFLFLTSALTQEVAISFERTELSVDESAGTFMMCVLKNRDTIVPVTVDIQLIQGSATQDVDYDSTTLPTSVTIQPNSDRFCLKGGIIDDNIAMEGNEHFHLVLVNPPSCAVVITDGITTITIRDDDLREVLFAQPSYTVNKNNDVARVHLTKDTGTVEDTATRTRSVTFQIAANDHRSIDITIMPDSEWEPLECFDVNLQIPAGSVVPSTASVCIKSVVIGLEQTRYSVPEAETLVEVCAVLMRGQLQTERIVTLTTSDITAEASVDYETVSVDLTFSATVNRSCVNVTIHEDIFSERPEEISAMLTTANPEVALNQSQGMIVIIDDEDVFVRFVEPTYTFGEAMGVGFIEVEKTGIVQDVFSVIVRGGPSTQTDVEISGVGVDTIITFGAGPTAPDVIRVNVTINDDQVGLEAVEMFPVNLELSQPSQAVAVGAPDTTIVNIIDDDEVTIRFGTTALTVNESAGTFMMCVLKNRDTIVPVTVDIQLIQGTATQDVDYDSTTVPTSVTIQPNLDRFCFNGGIIDDSIVLEGNEDFQLMLVNPSPGAVVITDDTTTITIRDDDVAQVSFERPSYTVNENDGLARICLLKDLESAVTFSVNTDTVDGSATSPDDYTGGPQSVTFRTVAGDRQCINIVIIPDSEREPIECFNVNIQIPAAIAGSVVPGTPSTAEVCIEDVGVLVNDTVIGDPLFIVPILVSDEDQIAIGSDRISLCYEIHGQPSQWFNLVTDECTSVNAYYTNLTDFLNVIERVAIRATDDNDNCREIEVDLDGCSTTLDGTPLNTSRYEVGGIRIRQYPRRVRVAVPNCAELSLIMWITCETRTLQNPFTGNDIVGDMIRFDVLRGLNFGHSDSHGLIGQFWNILVDLSPFNGTLRPGNSGENRYEIDFNREGSPRRVFTGYLYQLTWDQREGPCLYVGNRQGDPLFEVLSPNDPVIEGTYADYRVAGAFDETGFTFARFDGTRC